MSNCNCDSSNKHSHCECESQKCQCHSHEHHHAHSHKNEHHGCECHHGEDHGPHIDCGCGHEHCHEKRNEKLTVIRIILSAALLFALMLIPLEEKIKSMLFLIPYAIIGYDVLKEAIEGIFKGRVFDENFLMAVATIGAFLLGEEAEGVFVLIFYQTGELFQRYALNKSKNGIKSLMDIRPDLAFIEENGSLISVPCKDISVGTVITVSAGERIPLDGIIVSGATSVDQSAVTGESVPKSVEIGSEVYGGTINLSGLIKVKTTKDFSQSSAAKIIELMEKASEKKAKSEKFITRFSKIYTPFVCISALLISLLPPVVLLILGLDVSFKDWIMRGLSFLVISCPCALVMSVPLSFFGGIGAGSKKGILIKSSECLERLQNVKTVVFDKTGTLTTGEFSVSKITPYGVLEETVLEYAALCEAHSNHPLALGIKKAYKKDIDLSEISDFKELSGMGISVVAKGKSLIAGNYKLLQKMGIDFEKDENEDSVIYVCENGRCIGKIQLQDTLKSSSLKAVKSLKKKGIKTVILTGDKKEAGVKIQKETGIDTVYSELLPNDKLSILDKIINEKEKESFVAFVGDGINDAPCIARSDIGIAMGALGSDAAIEGADLVLMDDNLTEIITAFNISKKTMRIVKENIVFSLFIKAACLLLGAFGIVNMWLSIFADVGVMILAVLNALRAMEN